MGWCMVLDSGHRLVGREVAAVRGVAAIEVIFSYCFLFSWVSLVASLFPYPYLFGLTSLFSPAISSMSPLSQTFLMKPLTLLPHPKLVILWLCYTAVILELPFLFP